jgi:hypothetical protein
MEEGDYAKEEVAEAEEAEEGEEDAEEEADEEAEDDAEESEDEAEEIEDMTVEDLKDLIRDILSQEMGDMEEPAGEEGDEEAEDMVGMDMTEPEAEAGEEEINLEELMAELSAMANEGEDVVAEEEVDETINQADADSAAPHGNLEEEEYMEEGMMDKLKAIATDKKLLSKIITVDGKEVSIADLLNLAASGAVAGMKKSGAGHDIGPKEEVSEELNEALETIETLRKDLNEVNLLNAKLLYVNKVFKANNLTESQKATVIAAFDKAETVKEVKLVFETVSENVPSGKKEVVKEAKGFASAAVGTSDKPEVITEANEVVRRMQKLAGIIK